jgi:RHS repeat-associated protein
VLDSNGQVVEIQEYDPYGKTSFFDGAGNPVGSWSQVGNPFGWKLVRIDPETGLLYMRHRYYSPQWGRFLTQDPLGVWGDPATWGNSYSYGSASPLVQGDPFGLQIIRQQITLEGSITFSGETRTLKDGTKEHFPSFTAPYMEKGGQGYVNLKLGGVDNWHRFNASSGLAAEYPRQMAWDAAHSEAVNPWAFEDSMLVAEAAVSMVPGGGEVLDFLVLTDSNEPIGSRVLAGASLLANIFTLGIAPNFSTIRSSSAIVRSVDCADAMVSLVRKRQLAAARARGLGDDFARALDDIVAGRPRPNVRKPKPFANDGRGGTPRLPDRDSAGNPNSYTEHTVNPRPPGGSLDSKRIVTGSDGIIWGTTTHFQDWTRIR